MAAPPIDYIIAKRANRSPSADAPSPPPPLRSFLPPSSLPPHVDVCIVGAGISGIGAACHLQVRQRFDLLLLLLSRSRFTRRCCHSCCSRVFNPSCAQRLCAHGPSYVILERRQGIGGTWDAFKCSHALHIF